VITRDVVFHDRYGLHPRAARRIQASLEPFDSTVSLENLDGAAAAVDARGMLALISSGIRAGDRVQITADGADEAAAIDTIGDLLASGVCHPDGVR
jgi:phosphotransferase system HPr (HPr) family protein